jgi:hypothetical protein
MTKELVERDWIKLFDSVEPLKEPLCHHRNKTIYARSLYGDTERELHMKKIYRAKHKRQILDWRKKHYEKRKKKGVCVQCGRELDREGVRCQKCKSFFDKYKKNKTVV